MKCESDVQRMISTDPTGIQIVELGEMPETRPTTCPQCASGQAQVIAESKMPPLKYVRCDRCGHITTVSAKPAGRH